MMQKGLKSWVSRRLALQRQALKLSRCLALQRQALKMCVPSCPRPTPCCSARSRPRPTPCSSARSRPRPTPCRSQVTGFVESAATPLILCDGSTQIARSQLVNNTGLSIEQRRFAYSNVLEWKPQPKGELPVSGFPHHLDHGGYLSDGQQPGDHPRQWHRLNGGLSIRRGICIPPYYLPCHKNRIEWEQVEIPCLLLPDEKGLLRKHLCDEVRFECETDVEKLYPWDDSTVNEFTTNRARLDAELGQQTEFPTDAPMNRLRMHPDKLARRRALFEALVDMLEESPQTHQQCQNFSVVEKWHERLLQSHIDYLRKLRKQWNILNPTFPLTFALSAWGRGLQSLEQVWTAIMACSTQGRVEYRDPPKRAREGTPVAQTVLTDVPEYPSLFFKRNNSRSKSNER